MNMKKATFNLQKGAQEAHGSYWDLHAYVQEQKFGSDIYSSNTL